MILDKLENAGLYYGISGNIQCALQAIQIYSIRQDIQGRIDIKGKKGSDIYLNITGYNTRKPDKSMWEAHKLYADVQYIAEGTELIGYANIRDLALSAAYDEEKDRAFFSGDGQMIEVPAGYFMILFPEDAHLPCIWRNGTAERVRKIMGKVKL